MILTELFTQQIANEVVLDQDKSKPFYKPTSVRLGDVPQAVEDGYDTFFMCAHGMGRSRRIAAEYAETFKVHIATLDGALLKLYVEYVSRYFN